MNCHRYVYGNICFLLLLFTLQLCLFPTSGNCHTPEHTIKIAIIPHRSNLGNQQAYSAFLDELIGVTGFDFKWLGSKNYDDVINKIKKGEADIGYVGPFSYVIAQDSFGVKLICRTLSRKNTEFYRSMIVTRKDSGIQSLHELKGKSFSFTDPQSTSGYLFPMAQLKAAGIAEKDFAEVKFLKRHANSLLAVYKGHVDGGATSVTAADKIDIDMDQLKVIWLSEPIYRGAWIARRNFPEQNFQKIQRAMLQMNDSPDREKIFEKLTTKGFVKAKDSDYDNVREVRKWMQEK